MSIAQELNAFAAWSRGGSDSADPYELAKYKSEIDMLLKQKELEKQMQLAAYQAQLQQGGEGYKTQLAMQQEMQKAAIKQQEEEAMRQQMIAAQNAGAAAMGAPGQPAVPWQQSPEEAAFAPMDTSGMYAKAPVDPTGLYSQDPNQQLSAIQKFLGSGVAIPGASQNAGIAALVDTLNQRGQMLFPKAPEASVAAKMATETGLRPGTPEYSKFITDYALKTDAGDPLKQAVYGEAVKQVVAKEQPEMVKLSNSLPQVEELIKIANSPDFIAGAFTPLSMHARSIMSALGLNEDPGLAKTQQFIAGLATETAQIITNFGAGTGLSDADREYAKQAAGGDIKMEPAAIKRILDMNRRAKLNVLKNYNERVKNLDVPGYSLTVPVPQVDQPDVRSKLESMSPEQRQRYEEFKRARGVQ
jgi:hypothetical protein